MRKWIFCGLLAYAKAVADTEEADIQPGWLPPSKGHHHHFRPFGFHEPHLSSLPPPSITVSGQGVVSAAPDSATVSVLVSQRASKPLEAKEQLQQRLVDVHRQLNMGEEVLTIKPEQYRVNKDYKWNTDGSRELLGYEASQGLLFKVLNLTLLDDLIDKLLGVEDLADLRDVDLRLDNPASVLEEARAAAVKDTVNKARDILHAYGYSVGPLLKVEEQVDLFPQPMAFARVASDGLDGGPLYQGKPVEFRVQLTSTFAIGRHQPQCLRGDGICENETAATA